LIADWTVDAAPDSPTIDVPWEGWVDLREGQSEEQRTWAARNLDETGNYPELVTLLLSANQGNLFSSKVDIFPVTREEVDPEIAEAGENETQFGLGSYLDMVTARLTLFPGFAQFEEVARRTVANLGKMEWEAPCAVEIVVRPAHLFSQATFGWTLYAMGFGASHSAARNAWAATASMLIAQLHTSVAAL
jgi:hypothetical protein